MSLNLMPNRVKYSIIYNGTETYFKTSPSGWDGEAMALSREDNYGLNRKIENELTFTKDGAKILRDIFVAGGYAAKAKLRIYTRSNLFVMNEFGEFDIDFSNYKYNYKKGVTIQTKNMDLYALWNTYKSTNYQLYYPTSGDDVKFLSYSGITMWHKNLLQLTAEYHGSSKYEVKTGVFGFQKIRSSHQYTSDIQWIDSDDLLYKKWCCRALSDVDITLKVYINITIKFKFTNDEKGFTRIILTKADSNGNLSSSDDYIRYYYPTSGDGSDHSTSVNEGTSTFSYVLETISITLKKGEYLFFGYAILPFTPEYVYISDGLDSYIEIDSYSVSGFSGYKIQAVTHEYLIRTIFNKIYSDFWGTEKTPIVNFEVDFPYLDLITSTPAILQADANERYITTSLDNVLENLDKLRCIGLKFEDDTITICFRSACYPVSETPTILIPSHDIEEKTDDKYLYNKISYGNDYSPDSDDSNGSYEFNATNVATLKTNNVTDEKEYDLVLPFKCACIEIENYMLDHHIQSEDSDSSSSTSTDTDIFIFACNPTSTGTCTETSNSGGILGAPYYIVDRRYTVAPVSKLNSATLYNAPLSPRRILNAHLSFLAVTGWLNPQSILWQSCDYDATFYCQMIYESAIVYEGNTTNGKNIDISAITPMFIPVIATCEIAKMIKNITDIQGDEAYKEYYIYDVVNKRTYQGWADTISFDLDKKQARTLDLRLKALPT